MKPLRVPAYLLFKCREPFAEGIDAGVLLLERINLVLLRRKLPVTIVPLMPAI